MNNAAGNVIVVSQQLGDFIKIVVLQRFSQASAGYATCAMKKGWRNPDFKTEFLAKCLQVLHIALTFVAEMKILSHGNPTSVQSFDQNLFGKLPWTHTG